MWKQHFRMPYAIFNMLVKELHPHLTRRDTRLRKAVLVEKQIAMAIMYLAHKGSYATVATFFGVGKSTAYKAIIQVFLCMEMVLLRRAVYLGDYRQVMAGFEELGFPQVVGATDGCHISIIAPVHEGAQYINRKQEHSMILQATCDHKGKFLDLFTGFAGANHDSFVLKDSPIFHALKATIYVPGCPTVTIAGKQVGPILLGDGGYPIKPFLLIPFQVGHNRREGVYNRRLSKAHCVVERSFGRLKSRFCALQCGLDLSVESIPSAILACCILHNIIETNGEVLNGQNTSPETFIIDPRRYLSDDEEKRLGEEIRDAFVEYFNS
ncbi:protein ANTAGONIST OF LIKE HETEROCHROMATIN PROTEIN 1-like isoform X1 [Sceloporus undulatus]|uniref:protein ANTAGONIST OF LIKE HETEROCHROMATIN PROTEIN 1-like isoform X1 n=1 Tax=Sceloporus undulatus TaxID=8520 RepID=UPI001C4C43F2|nr:protein ANTAGONIST OF LIKE HETEROCHROMATIN PROTEIN 1-like isoform X1 [Sceloporus undulatus]XP_042303231.1 protein ANTAGONIST OF LIKE HETEROCHROMATIN PROTEIN 1-like isoform X1 [Sceloporus undulatus]